NRKIILINASDYIYKLVPFSIIRTDIIAHTPHEALLLKSFDLIFEKPQLSITAYQHTAKVGVPFYIEVTLKNPLKVPLTNCIIAIQGLRLNGDLHRINPVVSEEIRIHKFALVFDEPIVETIVVVFTSTELDQVSGEIQVPVHL
ncbi:transglutaminase-like protein, partial [Leptotrombidium deliense]